jgi:hypothetical protein
MHKTLLIAICILLLSESSSAQQDFLLLKKGNRTYQTFFKGSFMTFQLENYQWLNGRIQKLTNDSIYFYQMQIGMRPNFLGLGAIADTTILGIVPLALKNIRAVPVPDKKQSFGFIKNGAIFQFGAAGYALLNVFNTLRDKQPLFDADNSKKLSIAAAVFLFGQILHWNHPSEYKLGRKYKLVYIKATPE